MRSLRDDGESDVCVRFDLVVSWPAGGYPSRFAAGRKLKATRRQYLGGDLYAGPIVSIGQEDKEVGWTFGK